MLSTVDSIESTVVLMVTNLGAMEGILLRVNKGRWEIEESFRIMKDDFDARPAYVRRDDRIKAHFMTCFISLLIFRILEKKLGSSYTPLTYCPRYAK